MKLFSLKKSGAKTDFVFDKKYAAKEKRDALNGGKPAELLKAKKPVVYTVTKGPDHD